MIKVAPKLRFPEFTDEWQVKKLGDIVKFARGGTLSKDELNDTGRYPAIHYGQLFTEYNEIINDVISKTDSNTGKTSEIGDILMPTSDVTPQGLARASVVNENGVMLGGDINVLKPNYFMSSAFLSYMINSQKKKIMRLVSGTTVRHVYASEVSKAVYFFPSKPEQEKIADFLTAVDERIRLQEQKLAKLEQYKRGVMQQIFSQKIRFKDENGNEYPEWEERKLGNLIEKNKKRNKNLAVNYVQSISNKHGFVSQDEYFDGANIASRNTSNYFVIEKGTFAYNPSRINVGSLAYKADTETSIVSPLYVSFKTKNDLENEFLLPWLSTQDFIKQMHRAFEGSVRDTLSYEALSGMKITLPCKEEQQKIAIFLTTLDDKIAAEKSKLTAARQFKKALLQRMFV